jgi:hypothetical protein
MVGVHNGTRLFYLIMRKKREERVKGLRFHHLLEGHLPNNGRIHQAPYFNIPITSQ